MREKPKRKTRQTSTAGMTLVELVVIMAILGIFMGIAIPSVAKSFQSTAQARAITARYPDAWRALDNISNSIRSTYPAVLLSGEGFSGRDDSYDAGAVNVPVDELVLPVLDTGYAHLGSVQRVSYRVLLEPEAEDSPRGLIETRAALGAPAEAGVAETVLDTVIGLDFKYLDDSVTPPEWKQEWPPAAQRGAGIPVEAREPTPARLPGAVEITIFTLGKGSVRPAQFTTVVNIPSR